MVKTEMSRMGINIPTELLEQVDKYASSMNINRTSAVCVLLSQALNAHTTMDNLGAFVQMYQEAKEREQKSQ